MDLGSGGRGWIPFTTVTYHAVELGVILEATLLALALALALAQQMRQHQQSALRAEQLARLDPLTGLHNRRAFLELAAINGRAAERAGRPLSVIMLDLDHFKDVNDRLGHEAGDQALVAVAQVLRQEKRTGDVLARWGGEEFILLLPETDLPHAAMFAERLRAAIASHGQVTASLGAAVRAQGMGVTALIHLADMQLDEAKKRGRDQVCSGDVVLTPEPGPPLMPSAHNSAHGNQMA